MSASSHPIGGGERLRAGRRGRIGVADRRHDAAHEPRIEQRHVDRRDVGDLRAAAQRRQAGGDATQRALALARVLHDLERQLGQLLAGSAHDDDRAVGDARDDAAHAAHERRAVPLQRGLRTPHPARAPARQDHSADHRSDASAPGSTPGGVEPGEPVALDDRATGETARTDGREEAWEEITELQGRSSRSGSAPGERRCWWCSGASTRPRTRASSTRSARPTRGLPRYRQEPTSEESAHDFLWRYQRAYERARRDQHAVGALVRRAVDHKWFRDLAATLER